MVGLNACSMYKTEFDLKVSVDVTPFVCDPCYRTPECCIVEGGEIHILLLPVSVPRWSHRDIRGHDLSLPAVVLKE